MEKIGNKEINQSLHEVIGDSFGNYARYIIQDRAIPDIRDGLKPVQRRIIFAMHDLKILFDKQFKKSARIVGEVIGKYHPHGDTSVYDALVRMAQEWKLNHPLIEIHGNKGSIDDDPPAAMRYTETRLSELSNYLINNLHKDTTKFIFNFDDSEQEPVVLPTMFPNLLINGASGIAAGYSTNIAPHNLKEVIEALIYRIDNSNCRLDTLLNYIKGPDFPTGGIIEGASEFNKMYLEGKGRVLLKGKITHEKKGKFNALVISSIPYEVPKSTIIRQIDELIINDKIPGLVEVIDESDAEGIRIVVEIRKDISNVESIINYLYQKTSLKIYYNNQFVAISHRKPIQFSLIEYFDVFIEYQLYCLTKNTERDLKKHEERLNITKGLIISIDNLDQTISIIRKSLNKEDCINNLMQSSLKLNREQANAIVELKLYRLSSTDIQTLKMEEQELNQLVEECKSILANEGKKRALIKENLRFIKNKFGRDRLTTVQDEIKEIKVNELDIVKDEDFYVSITKDGYIKKINKKSFVNSEFNVFGLKEGDVLNKNIETNSKDTLVIFTTLGEMVLLPVYKLKENKWKDIGLHINNYITFNNNIEIVNILSINNFELPLFIVTVTNDGKIKKTMLKEYDLAKISKTYKCISLEQDKKISSVFIANDFDDIMILTEDGYVTKYNLSSIPDIGLKSKGVKALTMGEYDNIVSAFRVESSNTISLITNRGWGKRFYSKEIPSSNRNRKGQILLKDVKGNPHKIINSFVTDPNDVISILNSKKEWELLNSKEIEIISSDLGLNKISQLNILNAYVNKQEDIKNILNVKQILIEDNKGFEDKMKELEDKIDKISQLGLFDEKK